MPGYSGSYINWAINISDLDSRTSTVSDPINTTASNAFGGQGTTHHHVRIPTHQGYNEHVNWVIYNRPTHAKVYIINYSSDNKLIGFVCGLLHHDPDGIVIHIHDNNDSLVNLYGLINCVTKWPTFFAAQAASIGSELPFDPFDCKDDPVFRNWLIEHWLINQASPLDYTGLDEKIQTRANWYNIRNKYQPHEVNESTYITEVSVENRIFELSCYDIVTDGFLNIFEDIVTRSKLSDNYDLTFLKDFHQNYIDAQPNLQWFDSIGRWRSTGQIDSYLTSHLGIEACLIKQMFKDLRIDQIELGNVAWNLFYPRVRDPSWPDCENEWEFYQLPLAIQTELINDFDYQAKDPVEYALMELKNNWKNMDVHEINAVYQQLAQSI